jgi:hypothetical protein
LALIVPATAAASASKDPASAVSQYGQQPPTGGGKVTPGSGKERKIALDSKSAKTLRTMDKSTQKVLTAALTSSWAGAGETNLDVSKTQSSDRKGSSLVGSLLAPIVSPGAGSESRLIGLLAAIVAITAVLGIAAARKQRALHQAQR